MLTFDATNQESRLVHGVLYEMLLSVEQAVRLMDALCQPRIANRLRETVIVLEFHAQQDLDEVAEGVHAASAVPTNGHVQRLLDGQTEIDAIINAALHAGRIELGPPALPEDSSSSASADAPAVCGEIAATDGGHGEPGPGSDTSLRTVAADLLTFTIGPSEPEPSDADTLLRHIDEALTNVRARQRNHEPSQELDVAERRLYEARNEACNPRMQESARMKFEAVVQLLKGTGP
jgi:hypothetical protein